MGLKMFLIIATIILTWCFWCDAPLARLKYFSISHFQRYFSTTPLESPSTFPHTCHPVTTIQYYIDISTYQQSSYQNCKQDQHIRQRNQSYQSLSNQQSNLGLMQNLDLVGKDFHHCLFFCFENFFKDFCLDFDWWCSNNQFIQEMNERPNRFFL